MPKLVRKNESIQDTWTLIETDSEATLDPTAEQLLPLTQFLALAETNRVARGVWLASADEVDTLAPYLDSVEVVACKFDSFMDGRSFSQGRLLRDKFEFKGELRAVGAFIQDQLHYLSRCGFNAFSFPDDADIESLQESIQDFSDSYQAACDIAEPLFRRRA